MNTNRTLSIDKNILKMKNIIFLSALVISSILIGNKVNAQASIDSSSPNFNRVNENITLTGNSQLENGLFSVVFPQKLIEDLNNRSLSVILTPLYNWSALYVKEINEKGFVVKSESGDLNAKFFWQISTITNTEEKK